MSYTKDVMDKLNIKLEDIPNILNHREAFIKHNPDLEELIPFLETYHAQQTRFKRDESYEEPKKPFKDYTDEEKIAYFNNVLGVFDCRRLEDGAWAGVHELMFTRSICVGLGNNQIYMYRWCFQDRARADIELAKLKKVDDIPELGSFVAHRTTTTPLVIKNLDESFSINKGEVTHAW